MKITLILLAATGIFLRVWHLGFNDLWYDEAITYLSATSNLLILKEDSFVYFSIIKLWLRLVPHSEFFLRLPSVVFSVVTFSAFWLFVRKYFSLTTSFIAYFFLCVSPFSIWYAQEARCYSLLALLAVFSTYLLCDILFSKEEKIIVFLFSFITVLGCYTHPYYFFLAIAHLIVLILQNPKKMKLFLPSLFIFLFLIPRFLFLHSVLKYHQINFWVPSPRIDALFMSFENLFLGYNGSKSFYSLVRFLVLPLFFTGMWTLFKKKQHSVFSVIFFIFVFVQICIFLFSSFILPIYLDRGLVMVAPFYYLILAVGLSTVIPQRSRSVIFIMLMYTQLAGLVFYFQNKMPTPAQHHPGIPLKKPYKAAAKFLMDNMLPNDVVCFSNVSSLPSLYYYGVQNIKKRIIFSHYGISELRNMHFPIDITKVPVTKTPLFREKTLWLVACDWERSGDLNRHYNSLSVKKYLDSNFILQMGRNFDGLFIYKYVAK